MRHRARKLLVLDAAYSLQDIRLRGLEHSITSRDLGGYFEHVWSVHPLAGAEAKDDSVAVGPIQETQLDPRNTFIEARVGRYAALRRLPIINLFASQLLLWRRLRRLIRTEGVSVVRVGDPYYLGLLGLALARRSKIPLVVRINGNYDAIYQDTGRLAYPRIFRRRRLEKIIDQFVLRRANLVAAANSDNRDFALNNGADPGRTTIFRYGNLIDPRHFISPSDEEASEAGQWADGRPYLLYVGRLEPVKHPDDVLRALARAREEVPNLTAVLAGDGSMRTLLQTQVEKQGLVDHVLFAGNQDQAWLRAALGASAVMVCTQAGRALVEGALAARPIVAYDAEWHAELLTNESSGLLVPNGDWRALADAITWVVRNPREAKKMGQAAREATLTLMDPATLAKHERETYERMIGPRPLTPDEGLRILYLTNSLDMGGIETNLVRLARSLSARGHQVLAGTNGGRLEQSFRQAGGKHLRVRLSAVPWRAVSNASALRRVVREERPHVVHALSASAAVGAGLARISTRLLSKERLPPLISSVMGLQSSPEEARLKTQLRVWATCLGAQKVIVIAPAIERSLSALHIRKSKLVSAPVVGVEAPVDVDPAESRRVRHELGLQVDEKMVLTVGNLEPRKSHELFVGAAALTLSARSDVKFFIAGDGALRPELEQRIATLGCSEKVILLGERSDAQDLIAAADVYVRPGILEGFIGITVLEAQARGVPVVSFETEDVRLAITNGESGRLVAPGDIGALASTLLELLDDPTERERLGKKGRERVAGTYSIESVAAGLESIYLDVVGRSRVGS